MAAIDLQHVLKPENYIPFVETKGEQQTYAQNQL
jgi:hypothetical protein